MHLENNIILTGILPLVSVCMPAYNAERYVAAALDSVLAQTYVNLEVVVVNDGSTDGTAAVLERYRSDKVTVIYQSNQGQCAAANAAYRNCTGEYIKFFDADDLLSPNFIAEQVTRLNGRTSTLSSAAWGRFYGDDLGTFSLSPESVWRDMRPIDWIVESLKDAQNMMQCGLWLIPRQVLERSGLWDERLSLINDYDFFMRVLLASDEVLFCEKAVLYYRSAISHSLSAQTSRKAMESALLSTELGNNAILRFEDSHRTRNVCAGTYKLWMYTFYPRYTDLYSRARKRLQELGGTSVPFVYGGTTKWLSSLFGWRTVKQVKQMLGKQA